MTDPWGTWTSNPEAVRAFGDAGPWVRHLPLAWHAANLPAGLDVPLPADPTIEFMRCKISGGDEDDYSRLHGDTLAYWTPLLHLLCFGLGWTRPDLGLVRWMDHGSPTEDPILRLVNRWWGQERLLDFLAWAATTPALVNFGRQIATSGNHRRFTEDRLPDRYADRRREANWQAVWGGGTDPLHLIGHCATPMTFPGEGDGIDFDPVPHWGDAHTATNPSAVPRMVIVSNTYQAWYALFWHYRPERGENGRSIRTDLVCTPVGWLGEYRYSTVTGAWFRGRHRWHELGN